MGLFSKNKQLRSTLEAETLRNVFKEDYATYLKTEKSADLIRYKELDEYINSPQFKENKKRLDALTYQGSEYCIAEKKFKGLLKNKRLKTYYIIKDSQELSGYLKLRETPLYLEYEKLNALVHAPGFDKKLRVDDYLRFQELMKDEKINAASRFEKNKKYRCYLEIKDTELPQEFSTLNEYIRSEEFKKNRDFLLNKKRYETTDDYKLKCEYEELCNRHDIKQYLSLEKDVNFKNLMKWKELFSDEFPETTLDPKKWITKYYAGEKFLRDTYGTGKDVQLYTPDNVEIINNAAQLRFKKEEITGKYWDAKLGMIEKSYHYTSGMINTAVSHRQLYGRFEAKIQVSKSPVKQSFWLKGDEQTPEILIMENSTSGLFVGNLFRNKNTETGEIKKLPAIKLSNGYYIFTFEWSKNKMVWKINDSVVHEINDNIPDIPMYLGFSLGALEEKNNRFPGATMKIDWVRSFTLKKETTK